MAREAPVASGPMSSRALIPGSSAPAQANQQPPLPRYSVESHAQPAETAAPRDASADRKAGSAEDSAPGAVAGPLEPPASLLPEHSVPNPHSGEVSSAGQVAAGSQRVPTAGSPADGPAHAVPLPRIGEPELPALTPPSAAAIGPRPEPSPPELATDAVLAEPVMAGGDAPRVALPSSRPKLDGQIFAHAGVSGKPAASTTAELPAAQPDAPSEESPAAGAEPADLARRQTAKAPFASVSAGSSAQPAGVAEATDEAAGRAEAEDPPARPVAIAWQPAEELHARLVSLRSHGPTRAWAAETQQAVERLGRVFAGDLARAGSNLETLERLRAQVPELAARLDDRQLAKELLRAGHALERRLGIWGEIYRQASRFDPSPVVPQAELRGLALTLEKLDRLLPDSREGRAWREFLLLDQLRASLSELDGSPERLRLLAQEVVRRMSQTPMSLEQQRFLAAPWFASLLDQLRVVGAEPIQPARLLADLERYERTRLPSDAERLAADCQWLLNSPDPARRRLAQWVEAYYRNANVRICVAAELLNRFMPRREPEYMVVRDTILGRPVRGRSLSSAEVMVRTLPDPRRARLALEVSGYVSSLTSSWAGPARFWNDSSAIYVARMPLELDLKGIHVGQTQVQVFNSVRLRDLETDFDGIPLFGALAQGVARAQHEQNLPAANQEARYKIALRARERIESETAEQLAAASRRLEEKVLKPLNQLALRPVMISAATDQRRFAMRVRLAGDDQLGSQTPRPQAPGDSLVSFQFHESALNNALARLELAGRTFTLDELAERISQRLNCDRPWESNPEHEDVTITFAAKDPISVRFDEGQVVVTVSVAQLSKPPRVWEDFQVRAFYRPQIEGRSARLEREGVVRLLGPRLNLGSQIALRGIFSRTFSKKRPWELTPQRVRESAELEDLQITQFVLEDGWAGVAMGPRRTLRQRTAMSRR